MKIKTLASGKAFQLLLVICVVAILPFLGLSEYHTRGEPCESTVSYSMLDSRDWILPRSNGREMAYKPSFFHWSIAAVSTVANGGRIIEMTSRLPPAIALIATTLCDSLFFARRKGVELVLLATFITLTNFEPHRTGADCRVDMVLTALTVGALYCPYKWYEKGLKGIPWLAVLLMNCGTLTKGPVGTIIPCLVVGIFLLLRGVNFFKAFLLLSVWVILSLILPFCWYITAYQQGREEFLALVIEENLGRMTNIMNYNSCVNPWHHNLMTLFAEYVPWTLLVVLSLLGLTYHKLSIQPAAWQKHFTAWIKNVGPVDLFSFTSTVVIFVSYYIPQSKHSVYLMPIYPFVAYFLAKYLFYLVRKQSKVIKVYGSILTVISLLLFTRFIVLKCELILETTFRGHHAQDSINFTCAIQNISGAKVLFLVAISTILGIYWWFYRRENTLNNRSLHALVVLTTGLYLALDGTYQPAALNSKSVKFVITEIKKVVPESEGAMYEFIEENLHVADDPVHCFELNFYLHDRLDNFCEKRPSEGFLLIGASDAEKYLPELEKEGYQFERVYGSPKRVLWQITKIYKFIRNRQPENTETTPIVK